MDINKNNQISLWQLFVLLVMFTIGTKVVVAAGIEARQDLWIAEIITALFGVGFAYGCYYLVKIADGKNLYELLKYSFGKYIGYSFCVGYAMYFFYIASRNIRDFGELMKATIMPLTPIEIISITMMVLVGYTVFLGLEVMARVTEIIAPYIFGMLVLIGLLIYVSGGVHFYYLLPVLAEGFSPVFQAIFPTMLTFPYGEIIVFTVFISYVTRFNYAGKVSLFAVFVSGLLIIYAAVIQIITLGPDLKNRTIFPLLVATRDIRIMEFFERVDILVVFILMCGIFIKVVVFFYAGLKGLEYVFSISYKQLLIPIACLIPFFAVINAENIVEFLEEGLEMVPYYLHIPFQFVIPLILFLIVLIKKKMRKSKGRPGGVEV